MRGLTGDESLEQEKARSALKALPRFLLFAAGSLNLRLDD